MSTERDRRHRHDQEHEPARRSAAGGEALKRLASSIGNAAMARFAESGSGLLPGGTVHPDVDAAITSRRGAGSALDPGARTRIGSALGDSFSDVRVHNDTTADTLARSVEARAFTVGADVFFAKGEYQPGTASGDHLLAHELTHVVQQRGASTGGPLRVTDAGGTDEVEAETAARGLGGG
jgi:uncharacterized protein DUF4157